VKFIIESEGDRDTILAVAKVHEAYKLLGGERPDPTRTIPFGLPIYRPKSKPDSSD